MSSKFSPRATELPSLIYSLSCFLHGCAMLDITANKTNMLHTLRVYRMAGERDNIIVIHHNDKIM